MQERRLYPRYPWSRSVSLLSQRAGALSATTIDISTTGIALQLSRGSVMALAPNGNLLCPGDHLRLVLGGRDSPEPPLQLRCRVREVRRLSRDQYLVGTWFERLDATSEQRVRSLVDDARRERWS